MQLNQSIKNISDDELLTKFRDESTRENGFTLIVKKYQERLYWHIRRMVIEHEDANDVLQNVFIKVWQALDNFREEAQLYTWLYRIATNESITHLNSKKKKFALAIEGGVERMLCDKLSTGKNFNGDEIEMKLQKALLTLPEKQRTVFNLRYYDEMPYEEMAKVLETSVGALKANFHFAVKKVEKSLLED